MPNQMMIFNRRTLLAGLPLLTANPGFASSGRFAPVARIIPEIERAAGGPLGLAVYDSHSRTGFQHRANQLFPMCSTFKLLLAARLLEGSQHGLWQMDDRLPVAAADLLDPSPFTRTRIGGSASLAELAQAMVTLSDNPAANLALARIGGPAALTAWLRRLGDPVTRLDRNEPELNNEAPGDPRDTTTPATILATMRRLIAPPAPKSQLPAPTATAVPLAATTAPLAATSRAQLLAWMAQSQTANTMFRAALPAGWREANKTGAGEWRARNILSIITPPGRRPIFVAALLFAAKSELSERNRHFVTLGKALVQSIA